MDIELWLKLEEVCIKLEDIHGALTATEEAVYAKQDANVTYIGRSLTLLNDILSEKIQQLIQLRNLSLEEFINNKKLEEKAKECVQ